MFGCSSPEKDFFFSPGDSRYEALAFASFKRAAGFVGVIFLFLCRIENTGSFLQCV